jgi:hypothetical protein
VARAIIRYSASDESAGKRMREDIRDAMNPEGKPKLFDERGAALYEANASLEEIANPLKRIVDVVETYGAGSSRDSFDHLWVCLYNPPGSK